MFGVSVSQGGSPDRHSRICFFVPFHSVEVSDKSKRAESDHMFALLYIVRDIKKKHGVVHGRQPENR